MLSSNPAVPISSINFADDDRRRLSIMTHHGREMFTHHDGLPSPDVLTPIGHTPAEGNTPLTRSPVGTPPDSEPPSLSGSRRGSAANVGYQGEDGDSLKKLTSHRDDVSWFST